MINENGGPAFPVDLSYEKNGEAHRFVADGMTLRDYFAAKAMQSCLSGKDRDEFTANEWATFAYDMADAMLEARK